MDESRKQFDEWYQNEYGKLELKGNEKVSIYAFAKDVWLASREAIEVELPEVCSCCYSESEKDWHDSVMDEVTDILSTAGIKVKE